MSNAPTLAAIQALDGRIVQMLTPEEAAVLDFYVKQGRKYDVTVTLINEADPTALLAARSPEEADEMMQRANRRVSVAFGAADAAAGAEEGPQQQPHLGSIALTLEACVVSSWRSPLFGRTFEPPSDETRAMAAAHFAELKAVRAARAQMWPETEREGVAALHRLFTIAQSDTGQSRRVARFLLGLYNSTRFPFALDDLRGLDYAIQDDVIALLKMDMTCMKEVHRYIDDGGAKFEDMARDWGSQQFANE